MYQDNANPYSGPKNADTSKRTIVYHNWLLLVPKSIILLGFAYPLITLFFVHLVVLMEAGLGMHGAVIGSYKTPLGVTFNVAAVLVMGYLLFLPLGFIASIFAGWALGKTKQILLFPAIYIGLCVGSIALVLLDPIGVFEYFFD